ncbi:MAG TPA: pitrilysin family protein [Candidatus Nanoarchaeia archaeon]|nr:pitrilysin family protein [Candidatus Nanoarchaeia archaeon]
MEDLKNNFKKKILDNGLTIIFEKRDVPVVSIAYAVRCGGINESLEEKGISHFIEHMLYKGTPKRNAKKIAEDIEKNGGNLNGFTDETVTAYFCKLPSRHLDIALDVLTDMIKNPLFDKAELEKERNVIFEEIKMRKDNPRIYVFDKIQCCLYKGTLGIPLIGTRDTMNLIDREKIIKRFAEAYQPNNLILAVVGNADFDKIVKFAEKEFVKTKGKIYTSPVELKNDISIEERKDIDQANLVFAYHTPLANDKKSYAAEALSTLMAGGMSSRLFLEIREKRNLAYAVKGDSNINKDFSYNVIYIGTTKNNAELVKELILKEFEKIAKELGEEELEQVKEQLIGNNQISMEDSQNQMIGLISYEINSKAEDLYNFESNIRKVNLKEVKDLAKQAIKNYSLFALVPKD